MEKLLIFKSFNILTIASNFVTDNCIGKNKQRKKMVNMKVLKLKAYSVAIELDLNRIATLRGIRKKYTWEEPLILEGDKLFDILNTGVNEEQKVFLFSFGAVVLVNLEAEQIRKMMLFLNDYLPGIELASYTRYSDDYEVRVDPDEESTLTDEYIVVKSQESYMTEIIATVIAKSVALERVEEKLSTILDSIENVIEKLEKGKKLISNREHAKIVAQIVRHEYNTISYIMILDRPDVTWAKSGAEELYDALVEFFELADRYEILRKKTEIINSIVDNFTSISNAIRGLFVEWVIVALIVIEIIMAVSEYF